MQDLISIIIPVYNCEKYLEACVASVLRQSYQNFELILIDGGGTDSSGAMCDVLAQTDRRIRVLHKSNEGVSIARNKGIAMANGKWLCFIDSDDIIADDYLEKLYSLSVSSPTAELLICNIIDVYDNKPSSKRQIATPLTGNFRKDYESLHSLLIGPVVKLYHKDIIVENNIGFPSGISCGEDELFNFQYYSYVEHYAFLDEGLYLYYHRANESLSQTLSLKIYQGMVHKLIQEQKFYNTKAITQADEILTNSALNVALHFAKMHPADTYAAFCARLEELKPFINVHAKMQTTEQQHLIELIKSKNYKKLYHYACTNKKYLN